MMCFFPVTITGRVKERAQPVVSPELTLPPTVSKIALNNASPPAAFPTALGFISNFSSSNTVQLGTKDKQLGLRAVIPSLTHTAALSKAARFARGTGDSPRALQNSSRGVWEEGLVR